MLRKICKAKIEKATVTKLDLNYGGSIGISKDIMDACDLLPSEAVQVLNKNNGKRFETYIIEEKGQTGMIALYGPAARLGEIGDILYILSYCYAQTDELLNHKIKIASLSANNVIVKK